MRLVLLYCLMLVPLALAGCGGPEPRADIQDRPSPCAGGCYERPDQTRHAAPGSGPCNACRVL